MAASSSDSSIDEVNIAKDWHRACPSLRTIILPKGSVWFQGDVDCAAAHQDDASSCNGGSSDKG